MTSKEFHNYTFLRDLLVFFAIFGAMFGIAIFGLAVIASLLSLIL